MKRVVLVSLLAFVVTGALAADPHFAETRDTPVVLQITGYGPTGTTY